jgi:hypothetical protein
MIKVKQVNYLLKYIGKDALPVFTCSLHHINLTWIAERMVKMMLLNYMLRYRKRLHMLFSHV